MRLGISDRGLRRLESLYKEAIEYTDDWEEEWEEEYGEDWGEESYDQPDPEEMRISQEDFTKGEFILAGMGYDVENMSVYQIEDAILRFPEILKLVPQFNVQGQWVHTLQETHMPNIPEEIQKIVESNKELCVTAGDAAEFWNFSEYRMVAVVLEGTCKILWNADMFSSFSESEGKLVKSVASRIEFLNQMTEGWLVPSECTFVGIKANWEKLAEKYKGNFPKVKQQLEDIAQSFGVKIIETESMDKTLAGFEVIEAEEAMNFGTCEIDFGSPEHLYEPPEDAIYDNYLQYYSDQLIDAIYAQSIDQVQELLESGASLQVESLRRKALVDGIIQSGFPVDLFIQLIEPVLLDMDYEILSAMFKTAIWEDNFEYAEALVSTGYKPSIHDSDATDILELLLTMSEPPLDLIRKAYQPKFQYESILNDMLGSIGGGLEPEAISLLVNDLYAPISLQDLENWDIDLVKMIAEVAPNRINEVFENEESKIKADPYLADVVKNYIKDNIDKVKKRIYS